MSNPYLPKWEYIPDGEPRVFGDRIYVYGSHDNAGSDSFCDYVLKCWSAPLNDLSNGHATARYSAQKPRKTVLPIPTGQGRTISFLLPMLWKRTASTIYMPISSTPQAA